MTRLEQQLQALSSMSPAELRAAWREAYRRAAPAMSPELLARGIAWRLQARQHGGLPAATQRELTRLAQRLARTGSITGVHDVSLKTGTRLVRAWNGRTLNILVCDQGFEFEGRHYGSLTQIAREVTGTNWSGPRFFGLKRRTAPPSRKGAAHG